jgi:hypothetical protein
MRNTHQVIQPQNRSRQEKPDKIHSSIEAMASIEVFVLWIQGFH